MTDQPAPARGGRRSAEAARATRARIVELAAACFTEQGYLQTSMRDVARRASVTTGAVYRHFRSKADLLAEVIHLRTAELLEAETMHRAEPQDHVETLTAQARRAPCRAGLRSLIVQGAAAAHTDAETRDRLREEQLAHLAVWIEGYRRERDRMGLDPGVDVDAVVLHTWATELGLGVLEGLGIEPPSPDAWADLQNRFARSLRLPPDPAATPGPLATPGAADAPAGRATRRPSDRRRTARR